MNEFSLRTGDQRKQTINTKQIYENFEDFSQKLHSYRGSMGYTNVNGQNYLYKQWSSRGKTIKKSLGAQSDENDKILASWLNGRSDARRQVEGLSNALQRQASLNIGYDIARVPVLVSKMLRALTKHKALFADGGSCIVLGTNAMYAYEAFFGVKFGSDVMETLDLDIMVDARRRLSVAYTGSEPASLLDIAKSADKEFVKHAKKNYAMTKGEFEVEFIKASEVPPWRKSKHERPENDLQPSEIDELSWLINAPKMTDIAIGEDGYPVKISAVDPLSFAIYKMWMSKSPKRDPQKSVRDDLQARAVAKVISLFPGRSASKFEEVTWMPKEAMQAADPLREILAGKPSFENPFSPDFR